MRLMSKLHALFCFFKRYEVIGCSSISSSLKRIRMVSLHSSFRRHNLLSVFYLWLEYPSLTGFLLTCLKTLKLTDSIC